MAELDPAFDRVGRPHPRKGQRRDDEGKEALYSTSPEAPPDAHVLVSCQRCSVVSALRGLGIARLARPPLVVNPFRPNHLWARCPACDRRGWLHVSFGGVLRAYLVRGQDG